MKPPKMRLEKMVDLSGSEQQPEFQAGEYRRKDGEKGFQKRKYSKCDSRVWNPLFIRDQNLRDPKKHAF